MDGTLSVAAGPFAGRYTIERTLGRGATAIVYLARETSTDRPVAIKVLRRELAETLGSDRFLREIKHTQKLHHPRILAVLDSGEYNGQ
jgi:serine/threonine-protein kinase